MRSAVTNSVRGRWMLLALLVLCWTTIVDALNLGPEGANLKFSVETASPGTRISLRPGVYHGCNVSIPSGRVNRSIQQQIVSIAY